MMVQVEVRKVESVDEPGRPMHAIRLVTGRQIGTNQQVTFAADRRVADDIAAALAEGSVVAMVEGWQIVGLN